MSKKRLRLAVIALLALLMIGAAAVVLRPTTPSFRTDPAGSTGTPVGAPGGLGVEEIISKDIADGINAEARAKEARLRQLAEQLSRELSGRRLLAILGQPDTAKVRVTNGWEQSWVVVPTNTDIGTLPGLRLGYWPRVGVPFNGKNGQGYEVLYVWLDQRANVAGWRWVRPPTLAAGSLASMRAQDDYWRGVHQLSGAPPFEWPFDMPEGAQ